MTPKEQMDFKEETRMEYLVRWEIEVEADSPMEAALQARQAQVQQGTTAVVFDVIPTSFDTEGNVFDHEQRMTRIDLLDGKQYQSAFSLRYLNIHKSA